MKLSYRFLRARVAVALGGAAITAQAQTLRVGLAEDPDVLDPTLSVWACAVIAAPPSAKATSARRKR